MGVFRHVMVSTQWLHDFCQRHKKWLLILSVSWLAMALTWSVLFAPSDYQQGDAYRIMFVHVPCAAFSMFFYAMMGACGLMTLVWRIKLADLWMACCAPLGFLFALSALVTGAIWGQPMWGTWWVWDARLTSELLLAFLYVGQLALRAHYPHPSAAAKPCALLAIVGLVDLPIIHYSVVWWHTLHQPASVLAFQRPTMPGVMLWPLLASVVGFALLSLAWLAWRMPELIEQREWRSQWVQAMQGQQPLIGDK